MATTNTTHVNFVKVPTTAKFNDIDPYVDGTIYFIGDAKKIYLDGVMYGFNDADVANKFVKLTGDTMTGSLTVSDGLALPNKTTINDDGITFINTDGVGRSIQTANFGGGALVMYVGETAFEFKDGGFSIRSGQSDDPVKISGVADPENASDVVNLNYLNANVINKIGADGGIATLNASGHIPSSQLPSYVDDIKDYNNSDSFPNTGESDKIYLALDTGDIWRWSGSKYVRISDGSGVVVLGETESTAYRGDYGQIAYNHSLLEGNPHGVSATDIGLGQVYNYGIATESEAKAGSVNNKYMTPQMTRKAIEELAPRLTWTVVL